MYLDQKNSIYLRLIYLLLFVTLYWLTEAHVDCICLQNVMVTSDACTQLLQWSMFCHMLHVCWLFVHCVAVVHLSQILCLPYDCTL